LSRFHLSLLIHAHQPVGNFDDVIEGAYQHSYRPFLEALAQHPSVRVGLHYSGPLLEWIEERHPEYFRALSELVGRTQVELVGGGFYEPILIAIPLEDQREQLRRMADYLEQKFGQRPRGAWLAERVWEPQLPAVLAQAGVAYTLVDDSHFLASGFEPHQLCGHYIAEDRGETVRVIPGLKALRYLIPFRAVEETIGFLREAARLHPGGFVTMGDDCEKFGVWPGTYEHCYRDGWLERFFTALEANADWLATSLPGEQLSAQPPLGRAELPTASYPEMMEWALPTPVRQRFHALQQEFGARADVQDFLRGGFWRAFFSKYSEANLLHKKMLCVSRKLRRLARGRRSADAARRLGEARTHVLRAQCNDAYWHGIFGGLYAPALRTALWRELVRAEKTADAVRHGRKNYAEVDRLDFDADGQQEIYITARPFAALLKPSDGGTIAALDFREQDATLINSIQRRPEAYHARLRDAALGNVQDLSSIHEQMRVKEPGLEQRLCYDRWPRNAFRLLVFSPGKTFADYEALHLEEHAALAGGAYDVAVASAEKVELRCEAALGSAVVQATKTFTFSACAGGFAVVCEVALACRGGEPVRFHAGLEVVLNLLAPNSEDRYFEVAARRYPLNASIAEAASELRAADGWQKIGVTLEAPGSQELWIAPIETVSESEEGFERVYQGSQIFPIWPVELRPGTSWSGRVVLRVTSL
jgi:hypothetical protein